MQQQWNKRKYFSLKEINYVKTPTNTQTYSYKAKQKDMQQKCLQQHKRKHLSRKNQQQWTQKNGHVIECGEAVTHTSCISMV